MEGIAMKVFVLAYKHRHGTDLSAYETEALANEAAAGICAQFVTEITRGVDLTAEEPIVVRVRRLYDEGKFVECLDAYHAANEDESLEVEALEVQAYLHQVAEVRP
jgi:hypothetical protein